MSNDEEAKRLRRLIVAAAPYVVPSDAWCSACERTLISLPHAADCPLGALEREAGEDAR